MEVIADSLGSDGDGSVEPMIGDAAPLWFGCGYNHCADSSSCVVVTCSVLCAVSLDQLGGGEVDTVVNSSSKTR